MLRIILLSFCLIILYSPSNAQPTKNELIVKNYKNINIDFFTADKPTYEENLLFRAFKARIYGNKKAYLKYLKSSLNSTTDQDVKKQIADYGGFEVSETFNIDALFGSFLGRKLIFDFKNRIVEIKQ